MKIEDRVDLEDLLNYMDQRIRKARRFHNLDEARQFERFKMIVTKIKNLLHETGKD